MVTVDDFYFRKYACGPSCQAEDDLVL